MEDLYVQTDVRGRGIGTQVKRTLITSQFCTINRAGPLQSVAMKDTAVYMKLHVRSVARSLLCRNLIIYYHISVTMALSRFLIYSVKAFFHLTKYSEPVLKAAFVQNSYQTGNIE
jgi:hypothetical protein